jgi:glycosyltransferase involved in cell wall biosynthesis
MNVKNCIFTILAFNEEKSIEKIIQAIPKEKIIQIIFINNNSTDDIGSIAKKNGAKVFDEPIKGYGQACLTGIIHALEYNPETIAFLDGDYSDTPEELALLFERIDQGLD